MDRNVSKTQIGGDHYLHFKIQPLKFITANKLSFLQGCVIKRICRYKFKNHVEDLKKIKHEIDWIIKTEYEGRENVNISKAL